MLPETPQRCPMFGGTPANRDHGVLRAFAVAVQSELAAASAELQAAKLAVQRRTREIEQLKFQIAKLRRMQFGRSSERLTRQIEQLELQLEELEAGEAEEIAKAVAEDRPLPIGEGNRQGSTPRFLPIPHPEPATSRARREGCPGRHHQQTPRPRLTKGGAMAR